MAAPCEVCGREVECICTALSITEAAFPDDWDTIFRAVGRNLEEAGIGVPVYRREVGLGWL